jgi:DNA polymerase III delta prime subunit
MIGQKNNINTIIQWRCNRSTPRFIIVVGEQGSGRLTLAKEIMRMLNIKNGLIQDSTVSAVRDTIELAYNCTEPTMYIFRDADDMSLNAKNALLKVVEEPPNNAYFVMTIHNIDNMLGTIRSRGTFVKMEPYTTKELRSVCDDKLKLEYCTNISELQIEHSELEMVENCVDDVIEALNAQSGTRLLKACTQLKAKQTDTDKIDCSLFFKVFKKRFYLAYEPFNLYINLDSMSHIFECEREIRRSIVNKKSSIECMLIKLLDDIKKRGV